MGFKVNFTDNQSVSGQDISLIGAAIDETSPSPSFQNGILYGVDDLNAISKSLITAGVTHGMDISLSGETVRISQGEGFFADGKKITVDSDGVALTLTKGVKNYVWFSNDTVLKAVSAKCTTTAPSGDAICLGEISKDGAIVIKKDKACMKNSSLMPNYYERITQHISIKDQAGGTPLSLDLGKDFRRMVILGERRLIYINFDENKMIIAGATGIEEGEIFGRLIQLKSLLYIKLSSYENNILSYVADCSLSSVGAASGDFILDCM